MTGPVETAVQDGVFIGYTLKKAGVVVVMILLSLAVIGLVGALILVQYNTAKLAPAMLDRWTATDQADYETRHAIDVAKIVAREKALQAETNREMIAAIQEIREAMAGNSVRWASLEKQLNRIENSVFNGNYKRGGG